MDWSGRLRAAFLRKDGNSSKGSEGTNRDDFLGSAGSWLSIVRQVVLEFKSGQCFFTRLFYVGQL